MRENDWLAEMEQKSRFLKCLEETLLVDKKRNGLESLTHTYDLATKEETVVLRFEGGCEKRVPVTCNSNGANLRAIEKAVYW